MGPGFGVQRSELGAEDELAAPGGASAAAIATRAGPVIAGGKAAADARVAEEVRGQRNVSIALLLRLQRLQRRLLPPLALHRIFIVILIHLHHEQLAVLSHMSCR